MESTDLKNYCMSHTEVFLLAKVFMKESYLLTDGLASCEKTNAITHWEEASFTESHLKGDFTQFISVASISSVVWISRTSI